MRFQFIHAADLHIDSPLAALGLKDARVAATFAAAGRKAVEQLVEATIDSGAKFLIVAGDVFDGDWRDVSTGLFFAKQLGRLHRAGVRTFLIKGNHDALSKIPQDLPYPQSVHVFDARKGQTQTLEDLRVAIHGRSFPDRVAPPDFVAGYAARRDGWLNIGVLHTSLEGSAAHSPYAPCTVGDLARFGYDYWALGHIHQAAVIARDPWIVYPGNVQGRNPRETGPKGAMLVTVEEGRIVAVDPLPLDGARWAQIRLDVAGLEDEGAIHQAVRSALFAAHAEAGGLALAVRLTLTGETREQPQLRARLDQMEADARAIAGEVAHDCWVERLRLETWAPATPLAAEDDASDVASLLAACADDPEFRDEIALMARTLADKAPRELQDHWTSLSPAEWAERARDLLLGARA